MEVESFVEYCTENCGTDYLFLSVVTEASGDNILVRAYEKVKHLIEAFLKWVGRIIAKIKSYFKKEKVPTKVAEEPDKVIEVTLKYGPKAVCALIDAYDRESDKLSYIDEYKREVLSNEISMDEFKEKIDSLFIPVLDTFKVLKDSTNPANIYTAGELADEYNTLNFLTKEIKAGQDGIAQFKSSLAIYTKMAKVAITDSQKLEAELEVWLAGRTIDLCSITVRHMSTIIEDIHAIGKLI